MWIIATLLYLGWVVPALVPAKAVRATPPATCTWGGKVYADGQQFDPDPCTSCHCQHGMAQCAMMACRQPQCVDAVRDPDQCCPVCPNGNNCRAPDGTVVAAGKDVLVDNSMTCRCQSDGFLMDATQAVCALVGPVPPDQQ